MKSKPCQNSLRIHNSTENKQTFGILHAPSHLCYGISPNVLFQVERNLILYVWKSQARSRHHGWTPLNPERSIPPSVAFHEARRRHRLQSEMKPNASQRVCSLCKEREQGNCFCERGIALYEHPRLSSSSRPLHISSSETCPYRVLERLEDFYCLCFQKQRAFALSRIQIFSSSSFYQHWDPPLSVLKPFKQKSLKLHKEPTTL